MSAVDQSDLAEVVAGPQRRALLPGDGHFRLAGVDQEECRSAEALRLGLINRHVAADRLDVEIEALTEELAGKSPIAMKLGLEAFYTMQDMSFPAAMAYLQDQLALLSLSDDLKEGVTAFFEKRAPRFTGR